MVREIRHALYTIIRQASRDRDQILANNIRKLRDNFNIFQYPVVFTERLMAIIQERDPDIELALENYLNRGKADTLEEFIYDVKMYLSADGTTLQDWHRCIHSMEYITEELALDLSYLVTIIFDEEGLEEEEDIIQEIEQFHNVYQLIAPTREKQEQELIKIGIQLCSSCLSPQKLDEICYYCVNQGN